MTTYHVGYLVGSLAKASINRLLAKALVRLAPPELKLTEISFKDLPLYSYDYDADYPPVARAFKKAIEDPAVIATLAKYDMVPNYKSTEDYKKFVVELTDSERKVIDSLGLAKKTN